MDLLTTITQTLSDGKAENIVVLPTNEQSGGLFSQIVVATGNSSRHVDALSIRLLREMKPQGVKKSNIEISEEKNWALVDCGDIIVHIMQQETREYYQLESLWSFEAPLSG